jgi:hypothetical protein
VSRVSPPTNNAGIYIYLAVKAFIKDINPKKKGEITKLERIHIDC